MPTGPSEIKIFEQDRAHFTHKWKGAVRQWIWTMLPW